MHYIWNRAERVSEELMPNRVIECFAEWKSEEIQKLDAIPPISDELPPSLRKKIKSQRYIIEARIKREGINLEDAVNKFNNE